MKRINLKKVVAVIAFPIALLTISISSFAFGERGCVNNPDNNKGVCEKNVEGTYTCIAASLGRNCSSSD